MPSGPDIDAALMLMLMQVVVMFVLCMLSMFILVLLLIQNKTVVTAAIGSRRQCRCRDSCAGMHPSAKIVRAN
eukprot:6203598-Pleurochrysis_carterae.AAC.4